MIRTTRHTATFANMGKLSKLDKFLTEYARVTQYYIDYLWRNMAYKLLYVK